jgi:hypothetical protein
MKRGVGWYRIRGQSRVSLLVSLGIHLAAAVALVNIAFHYDIGRMGVIDRTDRATPERVRYVRVVLAPTAGGTAAATGPTASGPTATARLRAPSRTPVGIPQRPSTGAAAAPGVDDREGGAGRGADVTPATGVQPSYTDPRLWPQPGPFTPVPKTAAQRTDSAVKAAFGIFTDSLRTAEANKGREPGDWTIKDKGGGTWGWDEKGIRLGRVTIPQAVLSLLPLNVQANPTFNDPVTVREAAFRRGDLLYHANRAASEDEFRRAVKRIRERKDRERAADKVEKASGDGPQPAATPAKTQK